MPVDQNAAFQGAIIAPLKALDFKQADAYEKLESLAKAMQAMLLINRAQDDGSLLTERDRLIGERAEKAKDLGANAANLTELELNDEHLSKLTLQTSKNRVGARRFTTETLLGNATPLADPVKDSEVSSIEGLDQDSKKDWVKTVKHIHKVKAQLQGAEDNVKEKEQALQSTKNDLGHIGGDAGKKMELDNAQDSLNTAKKDRDYQKALLARLETSLEKNTVRRQWLQDKIKFDKADDALQANSTQCRTLVREMDAAFNSEASSFDAPTAITAHGLGDLFSKDSITVEPSARAEAHAALAEAFKLANAANEDLAKAAKENVPPKLSKAEKEAQRVRNKAVTGGLAHLSGPTRAARKTQKDLVEQAGKLRNTKTAVDAATAHLETVSNILHATDFGRTRAEKMRTPFHFSVKDPRKDLSTANEKASKRGNEQQALIDGYNTAVVPNAVTQGDAEEMMRVYRLDNKQFLQVNVSVLFAFHTEYKSAAEKKSAKKRVMPNSLHVNVYNHMGALDFQRKRVEKVLAAFDKAIDFAKDEKDGNELSRLSEQRAMYAAELVFINYHYVKKENNTSVIPALETLMAEEEKTAGAAAMTAGGRTSLNEALDDLDAEVGRYENGLEQVKKETEEEYISQQKSVEPGNNDYFKYNKEAKRFIFNPPTAKQGEQIENAARVMDAVTDAMSTLMARHGSLKLVGGNPESEQDLQMFALAQELADRAGLSDDINYDKCNIPKDDITKYRKGNKFQQFVAKNADKLDKSAAALKAIKGHHDASRQALAQAKANGQQGVMPGAKPAETESDKMKRTTGDVKKRGRSASISHSLTGADEKISPTARRKETDALQAWREGFKPKR